MSDDLLLSLIWSVPLSGALLVLLIPGHSKTAIKGTSLAVMVGTLALTLLAFGRYVRPSTAGGPAPATVRLTERAEFNTFNDDVPGDLVVRDVPGDLVVRRPWISAFGIEYYLGLDGIGLAMLLLTAFVGLLACGASWGIDDRVKGYFALFLLLEASLLGAFLALDLILFYVFFEVMLLPMFALIGLWGGERREYAAVKFLLYTLFGSVFLLVGILLLYFWGGDRAVHSFDALAVAKAAAGPGPFGASIQTWIFGLLFVGFAVKLPSFPFHTWLPDAHVEAPTPISMMLAGVLLKVGGYGLVRFAWPLAPLGAQALAGPVAVLGVVSILYGALAALAQTDFKKLVAYASVSHMGYVTLGLAAMNLVGDPRYYAYGVAGAVFLMIAHGITSTGMFFLVGVIYDRAHTRDLRELGGLLGPMPVYGALSFLIFFGAMGLPGLCGFVGEVFVILAAFRSHQGAAIAAAAAVVLTAGYILWTLRRVFLGRPRGLGEFPDLNRRELAIVAPLAILTVALGIFPQPFGAELAGNRRSPRWSPR